MPISDWSTVSADNSSLDSTINWKEGQAPSTVNNSARSMMAETAAWRDSGYFLGLEWGQSSGASTGASSGHLTPASDNANDIGSSAKTVRRIYSQTIRIGGSTDDLSTYSEGTFTPTLIGATAEGDSSYTSQAGNYTRVGNLVNAFFDIDISTLGSTISGALKIGGLPFNVAAQANATVSLSLYNSITLNSGYNFLGAIGNTGTTEIILRQSGSTGIASTTLGSSGASDTTRLIGNVIYQV